VSSRQGTGYSGESDCQRACMYVCVSCTTGPVECCLMVRLLVLESFDAEPKAVTACAAQIGYMAHSMHRPGQ